MSARQYHSVLGRGEANHTLPLCLIRYVGSRVIDTVYVIEVEDRIVVLHLDVFLLKNDLPGISASRT